MHEKKIKQKLEQKQKEKAKHLKLFKFKFFFPETGDITNVNCTEEDAKKHYKRMLKNVSTTKVKKELFKE